MPLVARVEKEEAPLDRGRVELVAALVQNVKRNHRDARDVRDQHGNAQAEQPRIVHGRVTSNVHVLVQKVVIVGNAQLGARKQIEGLLRQRGQQEKDKHHCRGKTHQHAQAFVSARVRRIKTKQCNAAFPPSSQPQSTCTRTQPEKTCFRAAF